MEGDGKRYNGDLTIETVIIGQGVTEIDARAFSACTNLREIGFRPNCKLTKLQIGAFAGCTALVEVNLPESLEIIHLNSEGYGGVFQDCTNLRKVTFGSNLKVIGREAFARTNMDTIEVKEGVTRIGERAFDCCSNLSTFTWPESIDTVGGRIFSGCRKLHERVGSDKQVRASKE